MNKFRFIAAAFVAASLFGCATKPPASCDGSDRRPVNQARSAAIFPSCGGIA